MGWGHPDISLGDLMELIKGFVDILILASGYQSSGRPAHWDTQNIKKAFQWAIFFENVLRTLSCLDVYQDSVKELDAALSEMTSAPLFPQGFAHLSSATLSTARAFVLSHFIHTLPLRDAHLKAFLMATIEMDIEELSGTENDCLNVYLNKLKQQNAFTNSVPTKRHNDAAIMSENINLVSEIRKCIGNSFTKYAVQELLKRWFPVSCVLAIEKGFDILSNKIKYSSWNNFDDNLFKEQLRNEDAPVIVGQLVGFLTWNRWQSKSLSYFLDKRTVRMVSGASMIFSAPKVQWIQVFERLSMSTESDDDFCETVVRLELLLLGCITSRWTYLIEHLMSISYNSKTFSEQYQEVCDLLPVRYQTFDSGEESVSLKEIDILEYLTGLLEGQLHQLWKISPALAAVAIPSWSPLLRLYLSEMESQLRGCSSTLRCCSCSEGMEHNDCELAERIWCLYIFHVHGSCQTHCAGSS